MKKNDLANLKRLIKQLRKTRNMLFKICSMDEIPEEKQKELEKNLESIVSQAKPLQEILFKEVASLPDPVMKTAIRAYYRGVSVRKIAEPFEYNEDYVFQLIKRGERIVINDE